MRATLILSALLLASAAASPLAAQVRSKKAAPKAAPAPAPAPEAPRKIDWDGEWTLVPSESTELGPAIQEHVKDLNFFLKKMWQKKLEKACHSYPNLFILSGENMSITYGKERPVVTPSAGGSNDWVRSDDEKFQASMVKEVGRFTQTLEGDGYKLSHTYSMRLDGNTIAMEVSYVNPKCPAGDFSYRLVFKRKG
ncbi:MAG TPA: hypothetical protein VJ600_06625 [Holophagaceae bacterium]|nr:hypothetical protein [Holophagaceae bacterium]